eukprot:jgi/Mesen1/3649/ME000200S02726
MGDSKRNHSSYTTFKALRKRREYTKSRGQAFGRCWKAVVEFHHIACFWSLTCQSATPSSAPLQQVEAKYPNISLVHPR